MPWGKKSFQMKTVHSHPPKDTAASSSAPKAKALLAEYEQGNLPLPPEIVSPRLAQLETWDAPALESGYRVTPQTTEDESVFPEIFAEEGADEAETEMRKLQEEKEQLIEREQEAEEV